MSMSMFFRNFLTQTDVKNNSCHETGDTEHGDDDPKIQKTQVFSSDDDSNSIASSNTELCGEIDHQDLEICDEETSEVVRKGDVNDLPPSECDESFGVNHWLCKVPSVVSEQVMESTNDKQKDPFYEPSNQDSKTTAVSGEQVKSRPISLVPVDLCGKGITEICIEKTTNIKGSIIISPIEKKLVATKESYLSSTPNSSNTALLNASEEPNKTIDHCVGKTREPTMKTVESYSNGITDQRQLLRKTNDDQENTKTHVHHFQLRSQVKSDHCNDKTQTEAAEELVLSSSKFTAVADQLPDNEDHVETSSHPLQLEKSRLKEKLSLPMIPNEFVTTSRIVCEDEVPSPKGSQCSITTQTLLSSENPQVDKEVLHDAANDCGLTSSLCSDAGPLLSSKLPPGSTLFTSQGVFRTTDKEKPFMCGFCGKTSNRYHTLNQHIALQHETLEKRYDCELCGRHFAQPWNLANHVKHHTQERPFACDQCGRRFKFQAALRRHTAAHTKDKPFSCKICHKSFESQSYLLFEHSKVHKEEKGSITCNIFKKVFNHNPHLMQHMTVHSGEKLFKCSFCGLHFRRDVHLQQHMITHEETRELLQEDVQDQTAQEPIILSSSRTDPVKVFQDNANLVESSSHPFQLENRKVPIEPSFTKVSSKLSATYPYQRKGYSTKAVNRKRASSSSGIVYEDKVSAVESLQNSTTTRTLLSGTRSVVASKLSPCDTLQRSQHVVYTKGKEKPFSCGICGKAYTIRHSVFGHIMLHHEEKHYSCEFCGKRFAMQYQLLKHAQMHTQEKPFTCDQCGKQFRTDFHRHIHKTTHSKERPFHCNLCNKSYKTKNNLSRHKESHKTEEQKNGVACDICKRKFSKALLKEHMRIHTGEKPFKCTLCEKQFRTKLVLLQHMDSHNGKKRLAKEPCSICSKSFWATHMPNHMRMHAGVKPFECNICGKRFPKKQTLEGHIRSHTGEKPFACDRCDKRFTLYNSMATHKAKCKALTDTLA